MGPALELIEVTDMLFFKLTTGHPDTGFRLYRGLKPGFYSEEEGGGTKKDKSFRELIPVTLLTSFRFLAQSSLGKSLL